MLDLQKAVAAAKPGDTVLIPPGAYGDVTLAKLVFVGPSVTLAAQDPTDAPIFRTLTVGNCRGLILRGLICRLSPDAKTTSDTAALRIVNSKRIAVQGCTLACGMAVVGIDKSAPATVSRPGDSIIGMPIGRGLTLYDCAEITIDRCDVSTAHKGIVLDKCQGVTITGSEVHHCRTSAISGGGDVRVRISGNHLHTATPWRYGEDPKSDHGDFIHLWTVAGCGPVADVEIRDNLIDMAEGSPIMSIFLEDRLGLGFPGVSVGGNTIINGDAQGIALTNAQGSVTGNVLLRPAGVVRGPEILLRGTRDLVIEGNTLHDGFYRNVTGTAAGGPYPKNAILAGEADDSKVIAAAKAAWAAAHRGGTFEPAPMEPPPVRDELRDLIARRTVVKQEPLKTKGRVSIDFKTPAESDAFVAAVLAVPLA